MKDTTRTREKVFSVTIKDCRVDTFRAGGKGGQNQNKRSTGVRITHPASGAVGEARDGRGQLQNKRSAFERMAKSDTFQAWVRRVVAGRPSLEERVDEMMKDENLRIEYGE